MDPRRILPPLVAALLPLLQGCYEYVPVDAPREAPVGQLVELRINDPGRVGLIPRFGPGLDRVSGRLIAQRDSELTLAVLNVTNLEGENTKWSGEAVQLDRGFVRSMKSRRLSATRTALLAVGAAAVLYVTAGQSLIGSGKDPKDPPDPVDPPASIRIPVAAWLRLIHR